MTVKEVEDAVAHIEALAEDDDEAAHAEEDRLYVRVLEAISVDAPNAQFLAMAALKTRSIRFARWCA